MVRDIFLGFIKIHILHHASHAPVYGVAIIAELRRHGYDVSPGTLYLVLHNLEAAGYLTRENRVVGGKVRKYYTLIDMGGRALEEVRPKIRELVDAVLEGHDPVRLPELPTDEPEPSDATDS